MLNLVVLTFLFGCLIGGFVESASSNCICRQQQWQKVSKSMISPMSVLSGVQATLNGTANGVEINVQVVNPGCGKGPGSGTVFYVRDDWTQIRYTQEFYGSATCWKIFGTTAAPKYRKCFAFGANIKVPQNNVKDFDASVGDGIFNQYRMTDRRRNDFSGQVYRCDGVNKNMDNFWYSRNGNGKRSATVVLRRHGNGLAGISTETSCGTPRYVIKDIWILV